MENVGSLLTVKQLLFEEKKITELFKCLRKLEILSRFQLERWLYIKLSASVRIRLYHTIKCQESFPELDCSFGFHSEVSSCQNKDKERDFCCFPFVLASRR